METEPVLAQVLKRKKIQYITCMQNTGSNLYKKNTIQIDLHFLGLLYLRYSQTLPVIIGDFCRLLERSGYPSTRLDPDCGFVRIQIRIAVFKAKLTDREGEKRLKFHPPHKLQSRNKKYFFTGYCLSNFFITEVLTRVRFKETFISWKVRPDS